MKKIAPLALMLIVCIFLTACGDAKKVEAEIKGNKLTASEIKKIAEKQAIANVVNFLKMVYSEKYDVSATRYKLGAITNSGDVYTVNGTLHLYDKYGKLVDTATFSQKVEVNDYGASSSLYNPIINFS